MDLENKLLLPASYLMVILVITQLVPTMSNINTFDITHSSPRPPPPPPSSSSSSWKTLLPTLNLTTSPLALHAAASDFGLVVPVLPPSAVLRPTSASDVASLLKLSHAGSVPFPVAARGCGHSLSGQAAAPRGVSVDMRALRRRVEVDVDSLYADVGGGMMWVEVLEAAAERGLAPVSWTDYLYLSVGGTLSNAGISGQSFQYGPQISNVLEMDVVTGKGEIVTCSPRKNSDLFHAVLGGLGQFGIITRARIPLQPAPERVKWVRVLYSDFEAFTRDQERLISIDKGTRSQGGADFDATALDYVEGSLLLNHGSPDNWRSTYFPPADHPRIISLVKQHGIIYCLEIVKYYDRSTQHTVERELQRMVKRLSFLKGFMYEKEVSYVEFLNRVRSGELRLQSQGLWAVPHPWLNLFVPRSRISDFNDGVFRDIVLRHNITTGPVLVYPMNRHKWDDRMSAVTPDEDVFYTVGFLHSCGFEDLEALEDQNREILRFCEDADIKIKQYLPRYSTQRDWMDHFGPKWDIFRERKARYDPRMVLSPGQKIFV